MGNLCGSEQKQEETLSNGKSEVRKREIEESEIHLESKNGRGEEERKKKEEEKVWKEIVDDEEQKQVQLFELPSKLLDKIIFEDLQTAKSARGVCKKLYCFVMKGRKMVASREEDSFLFAKFVSTNYLKEDYLNKLSPSSILYPNIKVSRVINSDTFKRECFKDLMGLDLSSGGMTDWPNLSHLTQLVYLNLSEAKMHQADPLSSLIHLKFLKLNRTFITSISPLENLHQLVFLDLHATKVQDLSPLSNMKQLKVLRLGNSHVSSLEPLKSCQLLEELECFNTKDHSISDLSPLSSMIHMRILKLGNNRIQDLSPLSNMKFLSVLSLDHSLVRDLKPLSNLIQLKYLDLSFSPEIFSVAPLSPLSNLLELSLAGNKLVESLWFQQYNSWWPSLTKLCLQQTSISDISFISQMKNLEFLNLSSTNVTDKSPLQDLPNLKTVLTEESKEQTAKAIYEYG